MFARLLWHTVHATFNLHLPTSIMNMFENGLTNGSAPNGLCVLRWVIWNGHDEVVFDEAKVSYFLHSLHKATLEPYVVLSVASGGVGVLRLLV